MALDLTKYYRCDTDFMKATNSGGRLHSAVASVELPNGILGYLGERKAGEQEIREFLLPTAELIKGGLPVIVMKPEIIKDESSRASGALGKFRNPANKAFPVVPFEKYDGIKLSHDYFALTGKTAGKTTEVEIGDMFTINTDGTLTYAATAPTKTANACYFKVVNVKNAWIANYLASDGTRKPQPYKLVTLDIVVL